MDSYIITLGLGGLATHDQSKTSNPIQNRHRHTNKVGTMIMIHSHNIVHASLSQKPSRFSQICKKIKVSKRLFLQSLDTYKPQSEKALYD